MPEQRHTKESIIQTLQNLAAQTGKTSLSKRDVATHMSLGPVNYHFGSLGKALEAAGLTVNKPGPPDGVPQNRLTHDDLFASLLDVEQLIGHAPTMSEYRANGGKLSDKPFRTRFGNWDSVLQYYRNWKAERGSTPTVPGEPCVAPKKSTEQPGRRIAQMPAQPGTAEVGRTRKAPQLFGEPIDFRGLRHAPINEQGVVYLFGMVSRELGFSVEALQQGFPDCEGKYLHDKKRKLWAKARIEFEFRASNFHEHCHDENECDIIVCWENDWPECPLRVVELRTCVKRPRERPIAKVWNGIHILLT